MPTDPAAVRSRKPADPAPAPAYSARLVRGAVYYLSARPDCWPDRIFRAGETVAVDEQVFAHLAARAVDVVTVKEPGRTAQQSVRKFALRGPDGKVLDKILNEVVTTVGGAEEVDPYQ